MRIKSRKIDQPKIGLGVGKYIPPSDERMYKKEYKCTQCGGDAYVAWHNDSKKDKDFFGAILHPGERLCLSCGKKRGVKFF